MGKPGGASAGDEASGRRHARRDRARVTVLVVASGGTEAPAARRLAMFPAFSGPLASVVGIRDELARERRTSGDGLLQFVISRIGLDLEAPLGRAVLSRPHDSESRRGRNERRRS